MMLQSSGTVKENGDKYKKRAINYETGFVF